MHFLLLGAATFGLYYYLNDDVVDESDIVLTAGDVQAIVDIFSTTWQRPPTQQELDNLIEERIREEIYYREAQAMGLAEDDTIIKRRLRQKLEFLTDDIATIEEPEDAVLAQYLAENEERYQDPPRLTFEQLFFSTDKRGDSAQSDAESALEQLSTGNAASVQSDSLALPQAMSEERSDRIDQMFGAGFAEALIASPTGSWSGPHESAYGLHLVRVAAVVFPEAPTLDTKRDAVLRDWQQERRDRMSDEVYRAMRDRYTITIEVPEWMQSAAQ